MWQFVTKHSTARYRSYVVVVVVVVFVVVVVVSVVLFSVLET